MTPDAPDRSTDLGTPPARLHPLTPIATALPIVAAIFAITLFAGGGSAWQQNVAGVPLALAICALALVVVTAYRYLLWQRCEYWFDEVGDLRIDSGLVYRNERKVQLSRLQAVDLERPLLARIFGLAAVKIDIAGTGDSKVALAYLLICSSAHGPKAELRNQSSKRYCIRLRRLTCWFRYCCAPPLRACSC